MEAESTQIEVMTLALWELCKAVRDMHEDTKPQTDTPRAREFNLGIARGVLIQIHVKTRILCLFRGSKQHWVEEQKVAASAKRLCEWLGYKPRLVLRAIRRIEAATSWARRRAEGRSRQASDIARAQKPYQEQIDAMAAMGLISGMGRK